MGSYLILGLYCHFGGKLRDRQDLSTINIMSAPATDPVGIPGAPEPSTWLTMGLGFAGLGLARWRRKVRAPRSAA
jgi:hypothetical protein